jgi:predicted methyltransferase
LRLVNDHDNIEKIAVDFDEDKKFIVGVVDFLTDIGWLKQDEKSYQITRKGDGYNNTQKTSDKLLSHS